MLDVLFSVLEKRLGSVLDMRTPSQRGSMWSYLLAAVIVAGALLIRLKLAPIDAGLPFLTFFPAVTLIAVVGGHGPGLLALVCSSVLASYLFIPPYNSLTWSLQPNVVWPNVLFWAEELLVIVVVELMYLQRSKYVSTAQSLERLKSEQQERRIAATAFESSQATMITDHHGIILRVNRAFTEITGYGAHEVIGRTPRMLKSGRHDNAFYAAMWAQIRQSGFWQGEIWDRRKNGEIFPTWTTITAVQDGAHAVTHYVGAQTDISERKVAEEEINLLAFYDVLTGLPNRRLLMDRLTHAMATSGRNGGAGALLFIDLDNFKTLNDTRGHDMGDLLLKQVAQRLAACVREGDTVGRLGGDEFVVIFEALHRDPDRAAQQVEGICASMLATLNAPYILEGHPHHSTPSIGVTLFSDHDNSIEELFKRADLAMYRAKASGRNAIRFFDATLQDAVNDHVAMEQAFRQGLQQDEFVLHFQVQVQGDGQPTGVEALVRWRHARRGLLLPDAFIGQAEENGLILPLGQWVLEAACRQLAIWAAQPGLSHLTMAVNVSPLQLRQPDYVEQVLEVLARTGADPRKLKLEVTESMLADDVEDVIVKMNALQAHGICFSLDDFGRGYSSLFYLKRLPLDQLKIDKSFILDVLTERNDAAIVRTIVSLGRSLGISVIAEGVESEAQRRFLAEHDCHAFQGFLFSRPLPLAQFEQGMAAQRLGGRARKPPGAALRGAS